MSRESERFEEDVKFILKNKDNWIFQPLYDITRRLILFYEKFYESEGNR